jgi:dienelactone hydrolase
VLRRGFITLLTGAAAGCAGRQGPAARSFRERRAGHVTQLRRRAPSPGKWKVEVPPSDVTELRYTSQGRELLAWYAAPAGASRAPALVYFHGEFSFARWDFEQVRPFLTAGFCVLTPSLRGENGNPGDFELLHGEVEDACAAVRWLAARPEVDASRIYTLGHSVGGGLSDLLALQADLPVACTASVGGIYTPATFGRWAQDADTADLVRFDPTDRDETELRVLGPHLAEMQRPHRAYVGLGDTSILRNARALAERAGPLAAPFTLTTVPGDHAGSLQPGIAAYLADLQAM